MRLTKRMEEMLMDCHEKELMNLEPCLSSIKDVKGLVTRGMLTPRTYVTKKGKSVIAFYITEFGVKYLNSMEFNSKSA